MDIYCPKCGEPWDMDSIHEAASEQGSTFDKVSAAFRTKGCVALGERCSAPSDQVDRHFGLTPQDAAGALYELLGDDMDGAAAMLDDMSF